MFFSPTLLTLSAPHLHNDLRVICLSSGNSSGIGHIRRTELVESCLRLGVGGCGGGAGAGAVYPPVAAAAAAGQKLGNVVVVEDAQLQDGMGVVWESAYIGATVRTILRHWGSQEEEEGGEGEEVGEKVGGKEKKSGEWTPSIILTFDSHGVSSHSNHISAHHGAKHYIRSSSSPTTKLYTLTTTSLLRKYLSILDFPLSYLTHRRRGGRNGFLFVLGPEGFKKARGAMTDAHVSQMRWFRWGWIWWSRYMVMNDLVEEDVLQEGGGSGGGREGGEKEL